MVDATVIDRKRGVFPVRPDNHDEMQERESVEENSRLTLSTE